MSKIFWLMFAGVIVVFGGVLYYQSQKAELPVPAPREGGTIVGNEKTYVNQTYGIGFKYPSKFVLAYETTNKNEIVRLISTSSLEDQISVQISRIAGTTTESQFEKAVLEDTIFDPSGMHPKTFEEFSVKKIGENTFYTIRTGRFEAVVSFAYFLRTPSQVLRFDVVSHGVEGWMDPAYDEEKDAGRLQLESILSTLQVI